MEKLKYAKPEVLSHAPVRFETTASGGRGDFPGLGHGVDGTPANNPGQFPGPGGQFPGKGPKRGKRGPINW
jgi:hypothetical protein